LEEFEMKTGTSMSGAINIYNQRVKKNIKPLDSNCKTCLYFNDKKCNFNKPTHNRKHCIKYEYTKPSSIQKNKKTIKHSKEQIYGRVVGKTTYVKLSQFLGVRISYDSLQERYKSYNKGYSMKIKSKEPLIIVLRNEKTNKKHYYEIIEGSENND
jgi:hypothetical protein